MQEMFFTSKQAAEITGCTLRQLQYWREKGVAVPVVHATGKGRSVYYSRSDLVALFTMEYCLSVGLSFEVSSETLKTLKEKEPEFLNPTTARRFMLWRNSAKRSLELVEFDLEQAITSVGEGQPAIPIWLDAIHQSLVRRLKEWGDRS
jgi:DNA-binding transcriptional MerR regulator